MAKTYKIAVVPGDGTGPEVTAEAVKVLKTAADKFKFKTDLTTFDFGGERYKRTGETLPDSAVEEFLRYDGPDTLPPVRISSTELTQVLINLVTNAAQALGEHGVSGGNVVVSAETSFDQISFAISDTGVGMPRDVLERIGTPFFTTKTKGTGLGIAQCQRLVGKAGGQFLVASEPGKGTKVTFTLPVAPTAR